MIEPVIAPKMRVGKITPPGYLIIFHKIEKTNETGKISLSKCQKNFH